MSLNLLLPIQCANAYANLLQMCSKKYGLTSLHPLQWCQWCMALYKWVLTDTRDSHYNSILIQSQHQRLNNFLCFQKQNISAVFYQNNYGNKPTRLYFREVLYFKVLYRNNIYIATSYRCVFVRSSLVYRRI